MAVCNLFSEFNKPTGKFLTFSQYSEDITRFVLEQDSYRVVPSSYMAFNIDYSQFTVPSGASITSTDINAKVPEAFQNYFENACAVMKTDLGNDVGVVGEEWDPSRSNQLLFRMLKDFNLIHFMPKEDEEPGDFYIDELKYRGDINIHSFSETDGMGYNEVYCYIPNSAGQYHYYYELSNGDKSLQVTSGFIDGWKESDELPLPGVIPNPYNYIYDDLLKESDSKPDEIEGENYYDINTIIVFYDIFVKDSQGNLIYTYKNVPMGIYFTGMIDESGNMTNSVRKYISNDDIFGEGTSYGLRICSKFVTLSSGSLKITECSLSTENYNAFCQVMSQMAESQDMMNKVVNSLNDYSRDIKTHLAQFKNHRANVPYIKEIGDESYWFVNGRNLGPTKRFTSGTIQPNHILIMGENGNIVDSGYSIEDIINWNNFQ